MRVEKKKSLICQKQETSQRKIAKQIQISQSTVHRALISEGIKKTETLIKAQPSDYDKRRKFSTFYCKSNRT